MEQRNLSQGTSEDTIHCYKPGSYRKTKCKLHETDFLSYILKPLCAAWTLTPQFLPEKNQKTKTGAQVGFLGGMRNLYFIYYMCVYTHICIFFSYTYTYYICIYKNLYIHIHTYIYVCIFFSFNFLQLLNITCKLLTFHGRHPCLFCSNRI